MESRQTTTLIELRKNFQDLTERIQKVVKFLENSTGKRNVRDAAVGALLSAIRQGEFDGLWDYVPALRTEWRVYHEKVAHTEISVDIAAYLPHPTYPDVAFAELLSFNGAHNSNASVEAVTSGIQRTNLNASSSHFNIGGREDGIPANKVHAHSIPAENARLRGGMYGALSPTLAVPSGGGRLSRRASREENRQATSAEGSRLQRIRAAQEAHEAQRGTVLRGQRPDGTYGPRADK
ncbi:hypothetical protein RUND412_003042 [Rhizina undulata]